MDKGPNLIKTQIVYLQTNNQSGLSLRGGGGFPLATINLARGNFQRKIEDNYTVEPKESPSCLIHCRHVVFTWQLKYLVTTLGNCINFL